jgi:uncharacterized membrane protein
MSGDTPASRLRENAVGIASTVVTGVWLAALFLGFDWWLAALLFGYVVVVPVVAMLFGDDEDDDDEWWNDLWGEAREKIREIEEGDGEARPTDETPLETLRRRYAEGELTDEQFERKLERILETETLEDAEERAARRRLEEFET